MVNKIAVIGSGFSGLSTACYLSKQGYSVEVFEKNSTAGGRCRIHKAEGFTFDIGPSWYWMPDVFEDFFTDFDNDVSDFYKLKRLDPSYRVYFDKEDFIDLPSSLNELSELFESIESGASEKLHTFLKDAEIKYEVGMKKLVHKPGKSIMEFWDMDVIKNVGKIQILKPFSKYIRKYFKNEKLIKILEFPVLFLGAKPSKTPALYSLMNYADLKLGTWYPEGGMYKIIEAMVSQAESLGAQFHYNSPITKISKTENNKPVLTVNGIEKEFDFIVGSADYHHIEQDLLEAKFRNYNEAYWSKKTMAPSSLIFYLGVNKKLNNLEHHNLFFDEDFESHASEIYDSPKWPEKPLFYVAAPSKSDDTIAPEGMENLFILIPVAPGLKDDELTREKYYQMVIKRLEKITGESVIEHVIYKKSYAHNDFIEDYNAYKGNAYGLANTLRQTSIFRPSIQNKKIKSLYYAGQLTVPGPGIPPAIISGKIVANEIHKAAQKL